MKDYETHGDLAVATKKTVPREVYLDVLTGKRHDTVLFTEIFGPQIGVKKAWRAQGATDAEIDLSAFRYQTADACVLPVNNHRRDGWQKETGEDAEAVYFVDDLGRKLQLSKNIATLPLPLNYPVRNMDDWLNIKPRYAYAPGRVTPEVKALCDRAKADGKLVKMHLCGGFDEPRQLMGEEEVCLAVYDQPELLMDMVTTLRDAALGTIEELHAAGVTLDVLDTHEDMAGKSGPLWGPAAVREFIKPYYLPVWERARECLGARVFAQDSDGDMNALVAPMMESGITCMYPCEPRANMDVVKLRAEFGDRLTFLGGLDKYALLDGPDAIDRELAYKVPPFLQTGGIVFGLDHRIVPGTTIANYRYYIRRFWEIAEGH